MTRNVPLAALKRVLRDVPQTSVERIDSASQVILKVGRHAYRMELLWAGQGWPSEVRRILAEISLPWPRHKTVAAKSFSPGALSLLQEADANWVDSDGQARIVMPPALAIVKEAPKKARNDRSGRTFRWSPSAIELAEFVLHSNTRELRTGRLADDTGWSPGRISQILTAFDDQGWTRRHGGASGRHTWHELVNPDVLLDAWAEHLSSATYPRRLGHVTARDLLQFAQTTLEGVLGNTSTTWALTTWGGLQLIAPFATTTPVLHVYLAADMFDEANDLMREAGIRPVDEGARIEFWEADFRLITQPGKPHPTPVASRPRLYADLLGLGGRGADAAQHLRETDLSF